MGVKQRKSWEQMSGKDFKLDAENKKGFILFLERGPEEWYNRKKKRQRALRAHSSNQTQFQGHKE